ncbi:Transcription initiation factor TFIID subunit 6 [Halotydeus destructor]|nr:Transcription initiation factor TFIID subunit 6 [Halotydeus destructor]
MAAAKNSKAKLNSLNASSFGNNANGPTSSNMSAESMKLIAESVGIANIGETSAKYLADEVSMRLRQIVSEAIKFTSKAKRRKMLSEDIDHSLKELNIEPIYGFGIESNERGLPFRFASGGGRELVFVDHEKEVDLLKLATNPNIPKIPPDVALKSHWLSIEGVQPAIPDNPPPVTKLEQRLESVDPQAALNSNHAAGASSRDKINKKKRLETVKVKQYATHELSVEQQLYYKEITEACVGSDETRRAEALQSLGYDSGLHQMLPRLCTFISEGVKVNVVQNNLALLIYLMRMVKAILDNTSLYLEKYLHELIPTIVTCIVSKQLCMRPEVDNHWALRDFAARLLAQTCKTYNTSTNNIQIRLTKILSKAIDSGAPLSSAYGALSGLCELGLEVQRTLVMKRVKVLGDRIANNEMGSSSIQERNAAVDHIKSLLRRVLPSSIKTSRPVPDILEEYKQEFGPLFGPVLHEAVQRSRATLTPIQVLPATGGASALASPSSFSTTKTFIHQAPQQKQQIQYVIVKQAPGQQQQ